MTIFLTGPAPACGRTSKIQLVWGSTTGARHSIYDWRFRRGCQIVYRISQILNFLRGTRLKHREKPHKLLQVSVILTPATRLRLWLRRGKPAFAYCQGLLGEMIQLPDCKSGVGKQNWKRRTGALPASPTNFGSVAQCAEQPVVCGKVEGASPFGSANLIGV